MFKQSISNTPFTTQVANTCFTNIVGEGYYGDYTFLSTLRALLNDRVPDRCRVSLFFKNVLIPTEGFENPNPETQIKRMYKADVYDGDSITIFSLEGDHEWGMKFVNDNFLGVYGSDGWVENEKVKNFFVKSLKCSCYMHPGLQKVVVFAPSLSTAKMHYLQCSILALLPWFFNPDDGISNDEMALIRSLMEKQPDKYLECLDKLANKMDFRSNFLRKSLDGFVAKAEEADKSRLITRNRDIEVNLGNYYDQIRKLNQELRTNQATLIGIDLRIANNEKNTELSDFFIGNKNVDLVLTDGRVLRMATHGVLTYFDSDLAEKVISNRESYIYDVNPSISDDDIELLMTRVFIDQILQIRVCAMYDIKAGSGVTGREGADFSGLSDEYRTCLPNPHIDRYACLGDYALQMQQFVNMGNYIGAIETCVASSRNLNFGDSTVMKLFVRELFDEQHEKKCVVIPATEDTEEQYVSAREAVEWLRENGYGEGM